jgi:phage-related protein
MNVMEVTWWKAMITGVFPSARPRWKHFGIAFYRDAPIFTPVGTPQKPCIFIGSSLKDLKRFPAKVQNRFGYALHQVQEGDEPIAAKALKGFGGRTVLELADNFDGDTYRAVYTVRFADVVYVLHAFQKKSRKGIATPQQDIDLIKARLRDAEAHHRERIAAKGQKP